jgi:serine/threonine-protein kinase RsbW
MLRFMDTSFENRADIFFPVHDWKPMYRETEEGHPTKDLLIHEQVQMQVNIETAKIKADVEKNCRERNVPSEDITGIVYQVWLALDEIFPNMLKHGHKGDPNKKLRVEWDIVADEFRACLSEQGTGFDIQKRIAYDPTSPENLENPDGRGMFLINAVMDEVLVNESGTQFAIRRRLEPKKLVD